MYNYYLFPLPRASKWNRPIFDHSEAKIDLYSVSFTHVTMTYVCHPVYTNRTLQTQKIIYLFIYFISQLICAYVFAYANNRFRMTRLNVDLVQAIQKKLK